MSGHHVTVKETHKGIFTQEVRSGSHISTTDVPAELGGLDSGPNPYDKLLSALGSCTSMTIKMYADLKKIPLEGVDVSLTYKKELNAASELVDVINRDVAIRGNLDQAQREKLLEIANKCPVHRTLEAKPAINTVLEPAEPGDKHAKPATPPLKPRFNPTKASQMRAVVVSSDGVGKFTQVVTAGKHTFKTDEPVEVGGLDSAPNPYEELLAALGSCTAMKVRREANVKGYSLDDVSITLDHAKVDGGGGKKIDVIGRSIKLQGNLTEEQRLDLLAAANRCPLMQTLTKGPLVTTALVESFDPPKRDAAPAAPRP